MTDHEKILEFNLVKEKLKEYAYTEAAKKQAAELSPFLSETEVTARLRETSEAKTILEKMGNPPLTSMEGIGASIRMAGKGGCLTVEQLEKIAAVLITVRRLKDFLERCKQLELSLPYYEENLDSMDDVKEEINRVIRNGKVDDYATKNLKNLRAEITRLEGKMREKADAALRTCKAYLTDDFCTARNGHICIPVKKDCKLKVAGTVIDKSSTGSTLFIEPASVARYAEDLLAVRLEEDNEVRTILYTLTAMLADVEDVFDKNERTIEKLDFIFAKGKLSLEYNGVEPVITSERRIVIEKGRHPLMEQSSCVPLDFQIGEKINNTVIRGVIITGPNTGGKTVAIKTVGINCMMAQSGLHVSCKKAVICLNNQVLCDIGDGQNISENLSTFSAHMTNALDILRKADRDSIVIMDELGSGTDPTEGMGIAIAILEELKKSEALYLVTTHYPEVKNYAEDTEGVVNARMAFDRESLSPLYRLEMGEAGESCAFYIAKRLGMPGYMLQRAGAAAYGSKLPPDFSENAKKELGHVKSARLQRKKESGRQNSMEIQAHKFTIGDSVMILPDNKIGIVCEPVNEKGVLRVQMQGRKIWINHKRVKLHVAAAELYPQDYDFSILFDTVEERKARHKMSRKYEEGVEIIISEGSPMK